MKFRDNSIKVFLLVVIVAFASLSLSFFSEGITGYSAKGSSFFTAYVSCHYKDTDKYGNCMRIERQEGKECNPPETIPAIPLRKPFQTSEHLTNELWRICNNYRKF